MSTLPDFKLTDEDVWVDLYTALSIPPGTPLVIQNKNSRPVLVQYVDTLNPSETLTVTARVISGAASEVGVSLIWQEDF